MIHMENAKKEKSKTCAKTLRLKEETAEKLNSVFEELGVTQELGIAKILEVYEAQQRMNENVDYAAKLTKMKEYHRMVENLLYDAVQESKCAKDAARLEFGPRLLAQERYVQELQQQLDQEKQIADELSHNLEDHMQQNEQYRQRQEELYKNHQKEVKQLEDLLREKDDKYQQLQQVYNTVKQEVEETKATYHTKHLQQVQMNEELQKQTAMNKKLVDDNQEMSQKVRKLEIELERIQTEYQTCKDTSKEMVEKLKAEYSNMLNFEQDKLKINYETKILNMKKAYEEQISKIVAENRQALHVEHQNYIELYDRIQAISKGKKEM